MEANVDKMGGGEPIPGEALVKKRKSEEEETKGAVEEEEEEEDETILEDDGVLEDDDDILEEDIHSEIGSSVEELTIDDSDQQQVEDLLKGMNKKNTYDWSTFAVRAGVTTLLHPSQMVQMLMQIGYEPIPPRYSVTLLGRPCLLLPSTGTYMKHIYQVDGFSGLYRGVVPKVIHQVIFGYTYDAVMGYFRNKHVMSIINKKKEEAVAIGSGASSEQAGGGEVSETSESESIGFFSHFSDVLQELGSKVIAMVATYPMHVVIVRLVAQFVGREHCIRRGVLGEIQAVYSDFGLLGFYRGMVPKILGETCQTLTVGALAFFVSNQAPGVQEIRSLLNFSFSILVSAWTYQFTVVSNTMAVNGSCLKIGQPPLQPIYKNWIECWRDLGRLNLLNRGSSIVCRYYTGPTMFVNGVREPTGVCFGPNHLPLAKQR